MKYTINGFSQEKLIEHDIDLSASLILRVIADMYSSNSKAMEYKIIGNEKYMWCTYGYLFEQIPLIGTEKTLIRKIDSLIEKGILKKKLLKERNGKKGNYLYISLSENYFLLTEYDIKPTDKMSSGVGTNCPNKDSSISDSSIADSLAREAEQPQETKKPKETANTGMYYQEIRMLLSEYSSINYESIAKMGKPIQRIRDVIKFAKENNKAEGWIFMAIRDNYKLEVYKSQKPFNYADVVVPKMREL